MYNLYVKRYNIVTLCNNDKSDSFIKDIDRMKTMELLRIISTMTKIMITKTIMAIFPMNLKVTKIKNYNIYKYDNFDNWCSGNNYYIIYTVATKSDAITFTNITIFFTINLRNNFSLLHHFLSTSST